MEIGPGLFSLSLNLLVNPGPSTASRLLLNIPVSPRYTLDALQVTLF